jgi:hypothetical protein
MLDHAMVMDGVAWTAHDQASYPDPIHCAHHLIYLPEHILARYLIALLYHQTLAISAPSILSDVERLYL